MKNKISRFIPYFFSSLSLFFLAASAGGQGMEPEALLGLTPPLAYESLGAPAEVVALSQEGIWEVVHYYPEQVYLFWFQSRVRQVRLDRRYPEAFSGLKMGMSRQAVLDLKGEPLGQGDQWVAYQLKSSFFPRRLRLIFEEEALVDAYYYRSDL